MKKLLLLIALSSFAFGTAALSFAQDAGPQGGHLQGKRPPRRAPIKVMEQFQKDVLASLDLSADQKSKIDALNKDLDDKIKTIITENKGTTGNKNIGSQRRQVLVAYNDSLKDVLGPDLWRQYREGMLAKMKDAREKRKARQQMLNGQTGQKDEMSGGGNG